MRRTPDRKTALPGAGWVVLAAAAWLSGCQSYPTAADIAASSAAIPPVAEAAAWHDGRGRFRQVFCGIVEHRGLIPAGDPDCGTLLWRLADEPPAPAGSPPLPPIDPTLRFFLVTGALSDCFGPEALPYRAGVERLAAEGIAVRTVRVSGRSSASHNARQIAGVLEAAVEPRDRVVLIGYSKGAVDILHFLDEFPEQARQVAAVVSLAGPILGSPLAGRGAWFYDHLLSHSLAGRCDPGDGGLADSMIPGTRREWLDRHLPPAHVAYFSVAAFTTRPHLASSLRPSWRLLAGTDPRNDGQVLPGDAVIPGSVLLGYANADHWGLAISIEDEMPHLAARPEGQVFPRPAFLEAILRQVSEALGAGGSGS